MYVYHGRLHKGACSQWKFTQRCIFAVEVYTKMNVYSGSLHKDACIQWGFTQKCRLAVGVDPKMNVYCGNLHEDACSHAMMIVNCLPGQLAAKWGGCGRF